MKKHNINFNLILALKILLEEKHVTRASKRLNISQPAMSAMLNRLRKLFNDELLVRVMGEFELTNKANHILSQISPLLRRVESFFDIESKQLPEHYSGLIHLGLCDHTSQILLPKINQHILGTMRNISLEISTLSTHDIFNQLSVGDIGLAVGFLADPPESLMHQKLFEDEIVCIFSRDSVFYKKRLEIDTFLKARKIYYSYRLLGELTLVEQCLKRAGYDAPPVICSPYMTSSVMCLLEDNMILVSTRGHFNAIKKYFAVTMAPMPLKNLPPIQLSQYWHKRYNDDVLLKWFRSQLKEICQREMDLVVT